MSDFHSLLQRQLRKRFGSNEVPEALRTFIADVNEAYHRADDDRRMLERAFELSSTEMLEANVKLGAALAALAAAKEQADQANQTKDEFLAMLGHELRNPIAPLVTALDYAKLRGTPLVAWCELERPLRQVVRLVDDLLDVARVVRGTVELDKHPLELWMVVRDALEVAAPLMADRHHHVQVDVPANGLLVEADLVRLSQVIVNLLTNAARCTEPGGRIRVSASREGNEVALRVRDSGIGIGPDVLPKIFDLFGRQRRGPQRSAGLGLGLTIVRNMVSLHGGTVTAESEGEGHGATFTVRLPGIAGRIDQDAVEVRPASRPSTESRRILVVDDNREAADLLAPVLEYAGHVVEVAHSATDALERAQVFAPQVAVLDVGLPEMTGHELGRLLQAQSSHALRLIALTGFGQASDREASASTGFAAHLVKPVELCDLLDAISGGP